jgi:hypothetical protein
MCSLIIIGGGLGVARWRCIRWGHLEPAITAGWARVDSGLSRVISGSARVSRGFRAGLVFWATRWGGGFDAGLAVFLFGFPRVFYLSRIGFRVSTV